MIWKTIREDEEYEISNTGLIRRKDNKYVRALQLGKRGYYTIKIRHGGPNYYVHKLVAEHFVENPDPEHKTTVNHIDGDTKNNNADNLEWLTPSENCLHYYRQHKEQKRQRSNGNQCVPVIQKTLSGEIVARFASITEAALAVGLSPGYLGKVVHGQRATGAGYLWEIDEGSTTMWEQNPGSPAQTTQSGEEIV